ncbi:MAG: glycosyltransferase [Patescibacteria group bacterium]
MKISIVVPAYNEEKYIRPCIESLVNQDFLDYELIMSLNACTDHTEDVVLDVAKKNNFNNLKIVKENRKGVSYARQSGAENAQGEIIASCDADTVYPRDWLRKIDNHFNFDLQEQQKTLEILEAPEQIAVVYGSVRMNGGPAYLKFLARYIYTLFLHISRLFGKDNVTGMNFAYRKDLFIKAGGYDLNLKSAEDVFLGQKLKKYGKVVFDSKIFVYTSPRRFEKGFWKFLWFHIKNYWNVFIFKKQPSDFEDIR